MAMKNTLTTLDGILDRRVVLEQPATGYRVAMDTVFLAAAVPALAGDRVLDLGCGVGGAMLALACRVRGITGVGIEIQPELAELCRRNIERNDFAAGLTVRQGDAGDFPQDLRGAFNHAVINPPYHEESRHDVSADAIKRIANSEKSGDLPLWIAGAAGALKPEGSLTIIHRADRRDEILACLQTAFGDVHILPLLPKEGAAPKRIILLARKNALFSVREARPLVLHKETGGYSDTAEAVLRHGQGLAMEG